MFRLPKDKKIDIAFVFLSALFFRLACFFSIKHSFGLDGKFYLDSALSIVKGLGFAYKGIITAYTVPVYPIFIAGVFKFIGYDQSSLYITQSVIGAITSVLIYLIALNIFNQRTARISGAIAAFYFFFAKCENTIMTEALFMPLVTVCLLLLLMYVKNRKDYQLYLFAFCASIATLTRSSFVLFPFFILGLDFIFNLKILHAGQLKNKLRKVIIAMLIFLSPIGCWAYRNYKIFDSFIPLATEAGHALYFSYHPKDGKIFGVASHDEISSSILKVKSEVYQNKLFAEAAINSIKKNPMRAVKYIGLKNMYYWSIFDWEILGSSGVYNFSTAFILPFFIIGIFYVIRKRQAQIILILPIFYTYVTSILFMGLPRNRYTSEQFMIIIASYCISKLYDDIKEKRIYTGCITLWLLLNIFFFYNSVAIKEYVKSGFEFIKLW